MFHQGRARVGRAAVHWQGVTTLRARARKEEQRGQRTAARRNRVCSARTKLDLAFEAEKVSIHAVLRGIEERPGEICGLENRLPAEGINSSEEHPLKEFVWLVGVSLITVLILLACLGWAVRWLAPKAPFFAEVVLAQRLIDRPEKPENAERSAALQVVADKVAAQMDLPKGMVIVIRYDESPMVNAYATLGGRIRVYNGLLQKLGSEDALAALLAHEIAHVKHRDVAAGMGRGLAMALLLGVVSADAGAAVAQMALGQAANLTMLGHSREREAQADIAALHAVVGLYGHAQGLEELFTQLRGSESHDHRSLEIFRSHPVTPARVAAIKVQAHQNGWPTTGPLTPLPAALMQAPPQ
ncbi:MAG: M48 family metallopeptidase [Rhizobacter sp.]